MFTAAIRRVLPGGGISWLSPMKDDNYAEYRDSSFLARLELADHAESLRAFWPARGPQWDALGMAKDKSAYFLVEAKANIPELVSDCGAKSDNSIEMISSALRRTQKWANASTHTPWTRGFYQYANRLAHLYFMNDVAKVPTYLISLYFVDDETHIPTSREQWAGTIVLQKHLMDVSDSPALKYVIDIFMDTKKIGKEIEQ